MTSTAFASTDAFYSRADVASDETVFWLQPRNVGESQEFRGGKSLSRLTASVGLSAFLTFGSVSAALAPALALAPVEASAAADDGLVGTDSNGALADAASSEVSVENLGNDQIASLPTAPNELPLDPGDDDQVASLPTASIDLPFPPVPAAPFVSPARADATATEAILAPTAVVAEAPIPILPATLGHSSAEGRTSIAAKINIQIDDRAPTDPNELLSFDGIRVPRWIVDTILAAAEVTDVDPAYLMALADKESSFIPDNKARSSSAEGLFQFIESTWLQMVRDFGPKYGLTDEAAAVEITNGQYAVADAGMREHILGMRRDSYIAALMAAEMMKRDRERIEQRIGRPISRSEYYLAHFFGAHSASRFMSLLDDKPKQSAPRVFPAAARANRALFFTKQGRKTRQLTVAEVYDRLDEMIDRRLERYEDVRTVAADASL
jgi:hypothetical protein